MITTPSLFVHNVCFLCTGRLNTSLVCNGQLAEGEDKTLLCTVAQNSTTSTLPHARCALRAIPCPTFPPSPLASSSPGHPSLQSPLRAARCAQRATILCIYVLCIENNSTEAWNGSLAVWILLWRTRIHFGTIFFTNHWTNLIDHSTCTASCIALTNTVGFVCSLSWPEAAFMCSFTFVSSARNNSRSRAKSDAPRLPPVESISFPPPNRYSGFYCFYPTSRTSHVIILPTTRDSTDSIIVCADKIYPMLIPLCTNHRAGGLCPHSSPQIETLSRTDGFSALAGDVEIKNPFV